MQKYYDIIHIIREALPGAEDIKIEVTVDSDTMEIWKKDVKEATKDLFPIGICGEVLDKYIDLGKITKLVLPSSGTITVKQI